MIELVWRLCSAPVCVPFYVFHKMLAGMLDQYNRAGNAQALQVGELLYPA